MSKISTRAFELLSELRENNNKEWFEENKSDYQTLVRKPFADLLESLSAELERRGLEYRGGEKTMFRVNRDVRFSLDKSPYSTHVSGVLTPSGTKSEASPLVYLHMESNGGFAVAGIYHPTSDKLDAIRQAIIENETEFSKVLHSLESAGLALDTSEKTKNMPRAFTGHPDHVHSWVLKLKNLMVRLEISKSDWQSEDLIANLSDFAVHASPLLDFLRRH